MCRWKSALNDSTARGYVHLDPAQPVVREVWRVGLRAVSADDVDVRHVGVPAGKVLGELLDHAPVAMGGAVI
jgi:hypothetical protein